MKQLPYNLIEKYFIQYAGFAKKQSSNKLNGCCWHCREGNSWGKKHRLWYLPDKNIIHCHNCSTTWTPLNWIKQVSGLSYKEILQESNGFDHFYSDEEDTEIFKKSKNTQTLPTDSINLFDPIQTKYYNDNKIVTDAVNYIKNRKLDTCINKTELYISLKDFIHKNRICIPFKDSDNKIRYYQTRAIYPHDEKDGRKYLSKANSEKTVFGLDKIDPNYEFLFITEGPIDSMFIAKNGTSMAGLKITEHQKSLLSKYINFEKIWILDNQLDNENVLDKYNKLIENNERIFIWPKRYKKFKDINELCCKTNLNQINTDFFINNSYQGLKAKLVLSDN
jgi:hypothetical protein